MITKESLKNEIDEVDEIYFEPSIRVEYTISDEKKRWQQFIESTYGSFSNEQIIRSHQGNYEVRHLALTKHSTKSK